MPQLNLTNGIGAGEHEEGGGFLLSPHQLGLRPPPRPAELGKTLSDSAKIDVAEPVSLTIAGFPISGAREGGRFLTSLIIRIGALESSNQGSGQFARTANPGIKAEFDFRFGPSGRFDHDVEDVSAQYSHASRTVDAKVLPGRDHRAESGDPFVRKPFGASLSENRGRRTHGREANGGGYHGLHRTQSVIVGSGRHVRRARSEAILPESGFCHKPAIRHETARGGGPLKTVAR